MLCTIGWIYNVPIFDVRQRSIIYHNNNMHYIIHYVVYHLVYIVMQFHDKIIFKYFTKNYDW